LQKITGLYRFASRENNGMSQAREAIRNASWNYIQAAVSVVLFLLLTPLVVQHLGMVAYGVWVLVHALLVYLNFFDLGIHTSLVRQVAGLVEKQHYRLMNCYVAAAMTMFIVAGMAAFSTSLLLAYVIVPNYVEVPVDMLPSLQIAIVIFGVHFLYAFPGTALDARCGELSGSHRVLAPRTAARLRHIHGGSQRGGLANLLRSRRARKEPQLAVRRES